MLQRATHLLVFALLLLVALPAWAQDPTLVTVREINAIPQAQVDFLNTNSATLTGVRASPRAKKARVRT